MENIISVVQLVVSVFLVILVLLQQRGAGVGGVFGGGGEVFTEKRGAEKVLFNLTIATSILFFGLGIAQLYLQV